MERTCKVLSMRHRNGIEVFEKSLDKEPVKQNNF